MGYIIYVRRFELRGRRFTNFHYYYLDLQVEIHFCSSKNVGQFCNHKSSFAATGVSPVFAAATFADAKASQ